MGVVQKPKKGGEGSREGGGEKEREEDVEEEEEEEEERIRKRRKKKREEKEVYHLVEKNFNLWNNEVCFFHSKKVGICMNALGFS